MDISLPKGITNIENETFSGCEDLKSIVIPESVTNIGQKAFADCSSLVDISLPKGITNIENETFRNCKSLNTFTIGSNIENLESYVFSGCDSLKTIYCYRIIPPTTNTHTFYSLVEKEDSFIWPILEIPIDCHLYIPEGCISKYKQTTGWSDFNYIFDTLKPTYVPVTSISLSETEKITTLKEEGEFKLDANILPENATYKNISWTSSNRNIATVDKNGLVKITGYLGECVITATAEDGSDVKAECRVIVNPILVKAITLNPSSASIVIGETLMLTASVAPDNATFKYIEWASSDKSIASVDINGIVRALSVGECVITATAEDGSDVKAECRVTVNPILVTSINFSKPMQEMEEGDITRLYYKVLPDNATFKELKWTSSDESIASVDKNGIVRALSVGECDIRALAKDSSGVYAICRIRVNGNDDISSVFVDDNNEIEVLTSGGVRIFKGMKHDIPILNKGIYVIRTANGKTHKINVK